MRQRGDWFVLPLSRYEFWTDFFVSRLADGARVVKAEGKYNSRTLTLAYAFYTRRRSHVDTRSRLVPRSLSGLLTLA